MKTIVLITFFCTFLFSCFDDNTVQNDILKQEPIIQVKEQEPPQEVSSAPITYSEPVRRKFLRDLINKLPDRVLLEYNYPFHMHEMKDIPADLSKEKQAMYEKYVGFYENRNIFSEWTIYSHFFRLKTEIMEWGTGYYLFSGFPTKVYYDELSENFYLKKAFTVYEDGDEMFYQTLDKLVRVSGPTITNPVFLEKIEMKKTRNEMYWDYFRHSTEDLELMFSTIIEFFTLIFDQEYQNISPVLSESHGIMISDIDSYLQGITPDIINYEEAIKSLETQKGAFYDRLRYLNYVLMNLEDSRGFNDYQLYLNAFFSEDIKLILDEFGEHALLLEFFYPRGNQYLSVIFLPEYDTFKLVYLNVQISFP